MIPQKASRRIETDHRLGVPEAAVALGHRSEMSHSLAVVVRGLAAAGEDHCHKEPGEVAVVYYLGAVVSLPRSCQTTLRRWRRGVDGVV